MFLLYVLILFLKDKFLVSVSARDRSVKPVKEKTVKNKD
ncbi:hypothetical protein RC62_1636 [Flavobacterium aquidurense]|uniref:Uncharacterized protein n=1 Tax=Flavobacterium aquidurense TaxID=362413 RepID=A0A0Q0S028_9FLAO|nr:hypothetical protein RC62_1636 [Flavobacterium aquidurense]